jgi:LDH2 family malate/lactate/ureidoglycolate dehydrogenase
METFPTMWAAHAHAKKNGLEALRLRDGRNVAAGGEEKERLALADLIGAAVVEHEGVLMTVPADDR